MSVNWSHPLNARAPIVVTLEGIIVFLHPSMIVLEDVLMIALQLLRESKTVFPSLTEIDEMPGQLAKASWDIVKTDDGNMISARLLQ